MARMSGQERNVRQTMQKIRGPSCALALLGIGALAWPAAGQELAMPEILRGYWYENDDDGQQQCGRYLADAQDELAIVGQLRVRERDFDTFSEYGEGNHSRLVDLQQPAPNQWKVSELSFIEGDLDDGVPGESVFRLNGDLLHLTYEYTLWHGAVPTRKTSERIYFRCI
jgi:hypothetical protein